MARTALLTSLMVAATAVLGADQAALDLKPLLEIYARGDFDGAVQKASASDLKLLQLRFVQDVPAWITDDPAQAAVRRAAAAAFLVEFAASRYESDGLRFLDLIEWMCVQLRTADPPTEFERSWHAATHALAGRSRSRTWMLGEYARLPHQKPVNPPSVSRLEQRIVGNNQPPPPPAHLNHALERFPDDPHFRLTQVVTWSIGRDSEPMRNIKARLLDEFPQLRTRLPAQLDAVAGYEPLTKIADVAAEA